jgi:hypothetical protein
MLNAVKSQLVPTCRECLSGKKIIYTFVFVIILHLTFNTENCLCQWQPDVRLTNDSASSYTSFNNAWCIASSGSYVHVVWEDLRHGYSEIYYKRSTDAGVSWGADTRLTNNTGWSYSPSVAVSGSVVHVVWCDERVMPGKIYYKRSTDAGVSWETDTCLTNNTPSDEPSVAVSGSVVHVVWWDYRNGNREIYFKRSINAGVSWGAEIRLTNTSTESAYPSVAASGSVVHVVWTEFLPSYTYFEIYYKRSTDAGVTWGADTRLTTNSSYNSYSSSVAVSGLVVNVVWNGNLYSNRDEIYYKRSTNGGVNWGADIRLTNDTSGQYVPSVAVSGSVVHLVWLDGRNGNYEIYYKRSTDGGISWGTDTRLTNNSAESWYPSVAVSGSVVHVVWQDKRDGNWEIYYKRNPTGNTIGIKNISSEIPSSYSLQQNYPNPFNNTSNLKFQIVNTGDVKLVVYDIMGREVQTLVNEQLSPGTYEVTFDASMLPSGIYFYRLTSGDFSETRKMILIK